MKYSLPQGRRSKRAPYRPGEPWDGRHQRRLSTALDDEARLRSHLTTLEPIVETYNDGAHWKISAGGKLFEWWPETGRVVIDKRWDRPRKCHDVDQVVALIRKQARR